jgi:general secretion pathway protein I
VIARSLSSACRSQLAPRVARSGSLRSPARRGMSLIEVLLALAILLLCIVAIGRLVDVGTDNGNRARMTVRGTRLAQTKMAEVEAGAISMADLGSPLTGTFESDDAVWSYEITADSSGQPPNLYHVTVKVTRDLQGVPFEVVLTQLVFDPAWIGSSAQHEFPPEEETPP